MMEKQIRIFTLFIFFWTSSLSVHAQVESTWGKITTKHFESYTSSSLELITTKSRPDFEIYYLLSDKEKIATIYVGNHPSISDKLSESMKISSLDSGKSVKLLRDLGPENLVRLEYLVYWGEKVSFPQYIHIKSRLLSLEKEQSVKDFVKCLARSSSMTN